MAAREIGRWRKEKSRPSAAQVASLVRKCLEAGARVEIDGLGVFDRGEEGKFNFTPYTQPKVFIAYVEEDKATADRIVETLRKHGCDPWLDRERLLPGQNWPRCIENAISVADYFVALFSRRSVTKRGQFQSELRLALDCESRLPLDQTFVIPVRLDDCSMPSKITSAIQYLDLFPDWDAGLNRLVRSIHQKQRELRP